MKNPFESTAPQPVPEEGPIEPNMNRREFLGLMGGAAVMAAGVTPEAAEAGESLTEEERAFFGTLYNFEYDQITPEKAREIVNDPNPIAGLTRSRFGYPNEGLPDEVTEDQVKEVYDEMRRLIKKWVDDPEMQNNRAFRLKELKGEDV